MKFIAPIVIVLLSSCVDPVTLVYGSPPAEHKALQLKVITPEDEIVIEHLACN